ncbi:MAG: FAD-dependent oxidoreductase, partial [Desulfofustis sp.]
MATLLLLGGGHAHMTTLAKLHHFIAAGHQVIVVQPSDYHYYSGMGPGMLGGTYEPEDIRFNTRKIVEKQGGTFIKNTAVAIDSGNRRVTLGDGSVIVYDRLSCNVGSYVPLTSMTGQEESLIPAKPIEKLAAARKNIVNRLMYADLNIAVIGGGPSAIEIAGNLRQLADSQGGHRLKISIFCGRTLLPGASEWLQKRAAAMLEVRT